MVSWRFILTGMLAAFLATASVATAAQNACRCAHPELDTRTQAAPPCHDTTAAADPSPHERDGSCSCDCTHLIKMTPLSTPSVAAEAATPDALAQAAPAHSSVVPDIPFSPPKA
jgi:hypothetical protein